MRPAEENGIVERVRETERGEQQEQKPERDRKREKEKERERERDGVQEERREKLEERGGHISPALTSLQPSRRTRVSTDI